MQEISSSDVVSANRDTLVEMYIINLGMTWICVSCICGGGEGRGVNMII